MPSPCVTSDYRTLVGRFPPTRYQGSKRKIAAFIVERLSRLPVTTVLDAFGGTGSVAYAFKCAGKHVTYNDALSFNHQIGLALIENDDVRLDDHDIEHIITRHPNRDYGQYVEQTFEGIYFTTEENRWLDSAVGNIGRIECRFKRALAWFALFQAAMVKRPYNLFHRKNLYMRLADVPRSFGNKASWDRSFLDHFKTFARQANEAVFSGQGNCRAQVGDALSTEPGYDLVYIDPPYINSTGLGVDYRGFYHFLQGLVQYDEWPNLIDLDSKHRRLRPTDDPWSSRQSSADQFQKLFARHAAGTLVVSYRNNGLPTVDDLSQWLSRVKRHVAVVDATPHQYALSKTKTTREVLLIGSDEPMEDEFSG